MQIQIDRPDKGRFRVNSGRSVKEVYVDGLTLRTYANKYVWDVPVIGKYNVIQGVRAVSEYEQAVEVVTETPVIPAHRCYQCGNGLKPGQEECDECSLLNPAAYSGRLEHYVRHEMVEDAVLVNTLKGIDEEAIINGGLDALREAGVVESAAEDLYERSC